MGGQLFVHRAKELQVCLDKIAPRPRTRALDSSCGVKICDGDVKARKGEQREAAANRGMDRQLGECVGPQRTIFG
jgi:hypothetical protein